MGLAIDFHEHFIQRPTPLHDLSKLVRPALHDFARHHWTEPVLLETYCFLIVVDAARVEQIFHV